MLRFENDYLKGCLPEILDLMGNTNMEETSGYRIDPYCEQANEKIKKACNVDYLDVHYLVGGTQTNMVVIDTILKPYQGIICPILGHLNVHEAGAIEGAGHKVITLSNNDKIKDDEAKIYPDVIEKYLEEFFALGDWHRAQPGGVYISHPTERGALYTKDELIKIKSICEKYDIPLYVDGARLSYALACDENDITLEDLAKYTDVFYIGGTKCGSMFGEAVAFTNYKYNKGFNIACKRQGAVLAKGRLLGLQFDYLFTDNNYIEKSKDAVKYAHQIRQAFIDKGIKFIANSYTNQQFPILNKKQQEHFKKNDVGFNFEEKVDENSDAVRFCTSWGTEKENVKKLLDIISNM
ncbi:threonine aldolase family protein [Peptostreptococcus equinus]|uniref:Beta-eliminating lyase-related protein n=1 Tax=Peptostreptococcus equinus TaxID=3003601 RepID=A0ABY7JRG9_9FIRM|nr:beta-eliminating lyase-related protein [Peptostreptococcus sp. CBA3647]WAW15725.1 beta-eliminating lyase-related protein [Peptostreptococcus sp. CBA3647]